MKFPNRNRSRSKFETFSYPGGLLGPVRGVDAPISPGSSLEPGREPGRDRNTSARLWKENGGSGGDWAPCDPGSRGKRARQAGLVLRMALFLGMIATKPFPQLLSPRQQRFLPEFMKTCNYQAGPGWERLVLLFFLPRYTASGPGQGSKRSPLPRTFLDGPAGLWFMILVVMSFTSG